MKYFKQISLSLPNSSLLLFIFTFLLLSPVFPQVTIREKVEIKPTDNRKRINSGLSHSLKFEFSTSSGIALRMAITKPCEPFNDQADSMLYGMGSIVYNVDNASPGIYVAVLGVWLPGLANGETTENHYRVFLDGILVNDYVTISPSGNHDADIFDPFVISYTTPFYSGFNITPFLDIMFTSQTNLLTYNLFNDSICSPGGWNPDVDPMTYSIISGAEFGTLTFDDQPVGSTFTILIRDSSRLKFLANDTLPNGQDQNVTIQASSVGITSTSTFIIQEPPIFCTKVILNPSTMGVGDTAAILLKKERPFRPLEDFPPETLFDVQIIDGQDFGTLLSSVSGDTMDSFTSIPAGFKFISTSNNGLDSVSIQIMASPSSSVNASAKRDDISKTISFIGGCNPTGMVTVVKNEPELIVYYPTEDMEIDATPQMPQNKKLQAEVKNYQGNVQYHWEVIAKWIGTKITTGPYPYSGDIPSTAALTDLPLIWNSKIRGGRNITIKVTADAGDYIGTVEIDKPFNILGKNPFCQTVKTYIDNIAGANASVIKAITFCESGYKQFTSDPNTPYEGKDEADIGICQINYPKDDDQVWNWQQNVYAGVNIVYAGKVRIVDKYINNIKDGTCGYYDENGNWDENTRNQPVPEYWYGNGVKQLKYNPTDFTSEQKLKEIIQRYNGGVHWRWVPDDIDDKLGPGQWVEEPTKHPEYVKKVWDYYTGNKSDGCQ